MKPNTVIFDQVYKILDAIRHELRTNYDHGRISAIDETVHFYLDMEGRNVIRGDEVDLNDYKNGAICTVSWDNTNQNLRTLARDVMQQL